MSIRLALVLTSLALVTACGSTAGGSDADPATSPADRVGGGSISAPGPSRSASGTDGLFPVTISRTGGIAGFNDRIVVDTGGATTVTSKRGAAGSCTLNSDTVTRLLAAVSSMPQVTTSTTTGPRISDEMFTTVSAPTTRGALRLSDAPGADLAVVGEIIVDVTGASPAYRRATCMSALAMLISALSRTLAKNGHAR